MRKILPLILAILITLPVITMATSAEAGSKNTRKLVGTYTNKINKLKGSKDFTSKRVLLVVGSKKKATTVEGLLAAVKVALSAPQHTIFVEPLLMAQTQEVAFAEVEVSGAFIKNVRLSKYPPSEHVGVATLVIQYTGDSTLPIQALANIKAQ